MHLRLLPQWNDIEKLSNYVGSCHLSHLTLVSHICVSESGQHCFRQWLVTYSAPSHCLNQCWVIIIWTHMNKVQWNFHQNIKLFIHENAFESIVCKMAAIMSCGSGKSNSSITLYFLSITGCSSRECLSKWPIEWSKSVISSQWYVDYLNGIPIGMSLPKSAVVNHIIYAYKNPLQMVLRYVHTLCVIRWSKSPNSMQCVMMRLLMVWSNTEMEILLLSTLADNW